MSTMLTTRPMSARTKGLRPSVSPDRVEHHVDACAIGQLRTCLHVVLTREVDCGVRSE